MSEDVRNEAEAGTELSAWRRPTPRADPHGGFGLELKFSAWSYLNSSSCGPPGVVSLGMVSRDTELFHSLHILYFEPEFLPASLHHWLLLPACSDMSFRKFKFFYIP